MKRLIPPYRSAVFAILGLCSAFLFWLSGCRQAPGHDPMPVGRLDLAVYNASLSADSLAALTASPRWHGALRALQAAMTGSDDAAATDSFVAEMAGGRAVAVFTPDVVSRIPDLSACELALGRARDVWADSFPGVEFPREVVSVVSPFRQSVFMVDTTLFIATNHFLGADYPGYEGMPPSDLATRDPRRMAVAATEALVRINFPADRLGSTALDAMLHEGAVAHAVAKLAGDDLPADLILGLDSSVAKGIADNEADIWRAIVGSGLLYSTDPAAIGRLVTPSSAEATPGVPSGAGRYIGFRILSALASKRGAMPPLESLLSGSAGEAPDLLRESGYNP